MTAQYLATGKKLVAITSLVIFFTAANAQSTILWQVRDTLHKKTSYLMGTYHQLGNHFVDSLPVIKRKLKQSELAIFESIDGNNKGVKEYIFDRPVDVSYRKALNKKYVKKLEAMATGWQYPLNKLTPSETMIKLEQEYYLSHCQNILPNDTWHHLDDYLMSLANDNGVTLYGLETDSLQVQMVNENTDHAGWKALRKNAYFWIDANLDLEDNERLCAFTAKYKSFDLDYKFDLPCPDDVLIEERNKRWMKILPEKLSTQNCFVAVGYLHLTRECGLISKLREAGFVVEPVEMR